MSLQTAAPAAAALSQSTAVPFPACPRRQLPARRGEPGLPALCAPALNAARGVAYPCALSIATQQRLFSGSSKL